jgi:hypothetical protein
MTTGQCDFCGKQWNPNDFTWTCHHVEPFMIKDLDSGTEYAYDEQWLLCRECDVLYITQDRKALSLRAAYSHPDREPGNLREMFAVVTILQEAFRTNWKESHPLYERRDCLVRLPNVQ